MNDKIDKLSNEGRKSNEETNQRIEKLSCNIKNEMMK